MLNSVAAGRRLALRAVVYQLAAVLLVALVFLIWGLPQALAAAVGGLAVVAGGLASARVAFGGGVVPAGAAMLRLLVSVVLKWVVVFAVLLLGVGVCKLAPLPLMAGMITGLIAQMLAAARRL
ncbi:MULTISPECIES: ATP synthase subunit I [unclassified Pseudoxanthomonas]|uniref:ATP synthase subunit I n=1 Tax=unclassified Pseudoxanthomonas TaxID=2645906 RepID=UPI0030779CA8